jgi:hypothetical protein|tara:strand:- start:16 stop:528 length:513 start_codon:yes stop_codon:yes gene_type:complete
MFNHDVNLLLGEFPYIMMESGIVICNFTSYHEYWLRADYTDTVGEILPTCTKEVADKYKLDSKETQSTFIKRREYSDGHYEQVAEWTDIELKYKIPTKVLIALGQLHNTKYVGDQLDIILIPFILMDLLKVSYDGHATVQEYRGLDKLRVCKKIDPRDNTKGIFNNRFCK